MIQSSEERRQEIVAINPNLAGFAKLLEKMQSESDRGSVLNIATVLDDMLKRTIDAFLLNHKEVAALTEGFNAPIGTFSARILAAFALGLITQEEYREANLIRAIRNDFAHSLDAAFTVQATASRCRELSFAVKDSENVKLDARMKFVTAASRLIINLANRPHYVSQKRLTYGEWKY